jgi:hypothetical protein
LDNFDSLEIFNGYEFRFKWDCNIFDGLEEFRGKDKFYWEENLREHSGPRTLKFIKKIQ